MVMNVKIYADGADFETMANWALHPTVAGLTTNPSLMLKAGIKDYRKFAHEVLALTTKPVSFEVLADDLAGMDRQAREIASWGKNVFVKVPITNTLGESTVAVIEKLTDGGIRVNVTAILTKDQASLAAKALYGSPGIISVFAGRIADTGRDPVKTIRYAINLTRSGETKVLWASTREVLNVVQAEECGCDIITCSPEIIAKIDGIGRDLNAVSLATVRQFHEDAKGYSL